MRKRQLKKKLKEVTVSEYNALTGEHLTFTLWDVFKLTPNPKCDRSYLLKLTQILSGFTDLIKID